MKSWQGRGGRGGGRGKGGRVGLLPEWSQNHAVSADPPCPFWLWCSFGAGGQRYGIPIRATVDIFQMTNVGAMLASQPQTDSKYNKKVGGNPLSHERWQGSATAAAQSTCELWLSSAFLTPIMSINGHQKMKGIPSFKYYVLHILR